MNQEPELELWRSAWTSASASPPSRPFDLRTAHSRQQRRLRIGYALNLLAAVALVLFAAFILRRHFSFEALVWAIVIWITTLGATAFSVWNWRVLWHSSSQPVLDYAAAYHRQCAAIVRASRFGYAFLIVQISIAAPWLTWDFVRGDISPERYLMALLTLAILALGFLAWFALSRRRALRQLSRIAEFQNDLHNVTEIFLP
jgi:hypothetical protein